MPGMIGAFYEVAEWAAHTFPEHTSDSIARHIEEEATELRERQTLEEVADLSLLIIAWLDHNNFGITDLVSAIRSKHRINKGRTWAVDPASGLTKHVG